MRIISYLETEPGAAPVRVLNAVEACMELGVSARRLTQMRAEKLLTPIVFQRHAFYDEAAVLALRDQRGNNHYWKEATRKAQSKLRSGENSHRAKLTDKQIAQMRQLHANGADFARLSAIFDVSYEHCRNVCLGKSRNAGVAQR